MVRQGSAYIYHHETELNQWLKLSTGSEHIHATNKLHCGGTNIGIMNKLKGIFRDPLIRSTLFSTQTDFIVYSERTLLY